MAVRATPKAIRLLEDEKHRQNTDKLEPMDAVKATWKCYIPAAVTGTVSVACVSRYSQEEKCSVGSGICDCG